jgi:outer membrane protein
MWIVILFWPPQLFAVDARGVTLEQSYSSALQKSETILDQREQINQAEEHRIQAKGGLFPTVSGSAGYLFQDASNVNSGTFAGGSNFQSTQPLVKVSAAQPLFRGFREYAGLRQAANLKEAQEQTSHLVELQLFDDLAVNFFTILSLEQDERNLQTETELYNRRIKELQSRVSIGRSRRTEVLAVNSSLAILKSQMEATRGQKISARENFEFLTGLSAESELVDTFQAPTQIKSLDYYLSKIEERPDIKTNQLRLMAASESVSMAKGAQWPSVDLLGNYYFVRTGSLANVAWDAQVVLTLPLFTGGINSSKVREASSLEVQSDLALRKSRRVAQATIRSLYKSLQTDWDQIAILRNARDLAQTNYELQSKDYRYGLVTNLEVLLTLTGFHETLRSYDHARFTAKLDFLRLENAVGKRP